MGKIKVTKSVRKKQRYIILWLLLSFLEGHGNDLVIVFFIYTTSVIVPVPDTNANTFLFG